MPIHTSVSFRTQDAALQQLYDALCAQVKKYPQMRCIPGWTLVPHIPGCFLDGLHPNELGMTFYANGLLKYLK